MFPATKCFAQVLQSRSFVAGVVAGGRPTGSPARGCELAIPGLSRPVSFVSGSQPNVVRQITGRTQVRSVRGHIILNILQQRLRNMILVAETARNNRSHPGAFCSWPNYSPYFAATVQKHAFGG